MAPKRKDFLKPKQKPKSKAQDPQSENDFLEAADEFEQAAGKWRAGDAAKATRFFNRAIDMYNEGLKRFPRSFDLAYNKANLEYNMCEDDRIVAQLGSRIALLEETLKSHRTAAELDVENTDVRFNMAQVLTSLAEALLESEAQQNARVSARTLLEESVDLFTKCLASQEQEYQKMQMEIARAQAEQENSEQANLQQTQATEAKEDDMETSSTISSAAGDWATVEEPLTPSSILETCTAQLHALTTLLSLYDPSDISTIEKTAQPGLETTNTKIPTLIKLLESSPSIFHEEEKPTAGPTLSLSSTAAPEDLETSPKEDALLATATFLSSLAEFAYRSATTQADAYATSIDGFFASLVQPPPSPSPSHAQIAAYLNALSAFADTLLDYASAVADSQSADARAIENQWTALTRAQTLLTTLTKGPHASLLPASRLADAFLARGDTDLFRFRLAASPAAKPSWANGKAVLVKNAGVYYRGAKSYAERAEKVEARDMALAKAVVAEVVNAVAVQGAAHSAGERAELRLRAQGKGFQKALEQMVEEGILGKEDAEGTWSYVLGDSG